MTKLELAQRALKMLYPRLRGDEKTSLREMVAAIGGARDYYIKGQVWKRYKDKGEIDNIYDGWLKQYNQPVLYNKDRCLYYSTLPATPLDLPNQLGIYFITDCNDLGDAYIPVKKTHKWLYSGSFAKDLEGEKMYFQEGGNIYFSSDFKEGSEVNITLIPSGADIDEDDPDFGWDGSSDLEIINTAVELYSIQKDTPEDVTNNRLSDR